MMTALLNIPEVEVEALNGRKSWDARYAYMYDNDIFCDVTFVVGKTPTPVRASKVVLCLRSKVFKTMFTGSIPPKDGDVIPIPDVEADVFMLLMKFIYTDKIEFTAANVLDVMYVAEKYMVEGIDDLATDFLKSNITPDNVCSIINAACFYGKIDLEEKCLNIIDFSAEKIITLSDFALLTHDVLLKIVSRDSLGINNEIDLYNAVLRWADAECARKDQNQNDINRRKVLGDVLFKIRFPLMGSKTFAQGPARSNVLTQEEKLNIYDVQNDGKPNEQLFLAEKRSKGLTPTFTFRVDELNFWEKPTTNASEMSVTPELFLRQCSFRGNDCQRCRKNSCQDMTYWNPCLSIHLRFSRNNVVDLMAILAKFRECHLTVIKNSYTKKTIKIQMVPGQRKYESFLGRYSELFGSNYRLFNATDDLPRTVTFKCNLLY